MYLWASDEIEKILIQLDERCFPFKKYSFTRQEKKLNLLGKGGFALVYEARARSDYNAKHAIKVIGFGEKHVDSQFFKSSVEAQKELCLSGDTIVKVYDYVELLIWIDEKNNVTKVERANGKSCETNCLRLQFILMEKIDVVLYTDKSEKAKVFPGKLRTFDEREILKCAFDIGNALSLAHEKKILHRDVKLENIFYTQKGKHYKLGDFGIAKVTDDGMASTLTFTKGYSAPEVVGSLDEKYDYTADIYSFGIMLYVLLNHLKFPGSETYHVNHKEQYTQGYILPRPKTGSDKLCKIIEKMCMYNPDDRYQSMEEVLNDLETVVFNDGVRYKREHKNTSLVVGTVLLFLGTIAFKLTFIPELAVELTAMMYLFIVLSFVKTVLKNVKKDVNLISLVLLGLGIYLLITAGFSWWKLILLLCIVFSSGNFAGLSAGVILIMNVIYLLTEQSNTFPLNLKEYQWMAITLLLLALVLLFQFSMLNERNNSLTYLYFVYDTYWIIICLIYAFVLFGSVIFEYMILSDKGIAETEKWNMLLSSDLTKIGLLGLTFCVFWIVREKVMMYLEKQAGRK